MDRADPALNGAAASGERSKPSAGRWIGYLFALAALIWVFHDIHPERVLRDIARVQWRWVALAICLDLLSYVGQGLRWKLLLQPLGRVRLSQSVRAIYAGLFANEVLPLRSGELLRTYLVSRAGGISFARVLASIGVERLIDGAVLATAVAVVSIFVPLPAKFEQAADILGASVLLLVGLVVLLLYWARRSARVTSPHKWSARLLGKLSPVLESLPAMSTAPTFYPALLASLLTPLCQILALWLMLQSYGINLPVLAAAAVLFVINLGVALPNAPANVGSYQFFCVLGLTVFGIDKSTAAGFSLFVFVLLTVPLLLAGFVAVTQSGLSFSGMRKQVGRLVGERASGVAENPAPRNHDSSK